MSAVSTMMPILADFGEWEIGGCLYSFLQASVLPRLLTINMYCCYHQENEHIKTILIRGEITYFTPCAYPWCPMENIIALFQELCFPKIY